MIYRKFLLIGILLIISFRFNAQNNCNVALIRSTLTTAGCVELTGMDNSCSLYFYNPLEQESNQAQSFAESLGANLISIQSITENNALTAALSAQGYTNNVIWIGYHDLNNEGTFEWFDGSSSPYTNWLAGEPDNGILGGEDCVQILPSSAGQWNDKECDASNTSSVIEVGLCPVVTVTANIVSPCVGNNVTLTASTILGSPSYTYTWIQSGTDTYTINPGGNSITLTLNGANTFTVISTGRYGCQGSKIFSISPTGPCPNNCDLNLIRSTFANVGCVELNGMDNSCSLYFYNPQVQESDQAQSFAASLGANLVSLQSITENNTLSLALNNQGYGNNIIWIGYNDITNEGNFVWFDESNTPYTNWLPGEPNNFSNEDCVQIIPTNNGQWNDEDCDASNTSSVIEVSLCPIVTVTANIAAPCIGSKVTLTAKTILGSPNYTYSWQHSGTDTYTVNPGGNSVTVKLTASNTFTVISTGRYGCQGSTTFSIAPTGPCPNNCDLDLIRTSFANAGCVELNGMDNSCSLYFYNPQVQESDQAQLFASNLGANLVSIQSITENNSLSAALANQGFGNNIIWIGYNDLDDEGNFVWFDESPSPFTNWLPGEPNDSFGEDCVQIIPTNNGQWNDEDCDSGNSSSVIEVSLCPVVTINPISSSPCAGTDLTLTAKTILGSPSYTYTWIQSGTDTYTVNPGGNSITVSVNTPSTFTVISTGRYGCTGTATAVITPTVCPVPNNCNLNLIRSTLASAGCVELLNMDNSCSLYFYNPLKQESPQAQAFAESLGGNLASIQSITENNQLSAALANQGYANKIIWIGYNDLANEGNFVWSDGSTSTFTNWLPGEPNDSGTEDCVQIKPNSAGRWNDKECDSNNSSSVIEIGLCPVVTVTASVAAPCVNSNVTLTANTKLGSPNYTYTWLQSGTETFTATPNGSAITVTSTGPNTFTVISTGRYGCTGSATIALNPIPNPTLTATPPSTICLGKSVTLNVSGATNYTWMPNNSNNSSLNETPLTTTVYTVTGEALGCTSTTVTSITVLTTPTATFSPVNACASSTIALNNTSSITGANNISGYAWDFGPSANQPTNSTQNPSNLSYATAGQYSITLTILANNTCTASITKTVTVYPNPVANFTFNNSCVNAQPSLFDASNSSIANGAIGLYIWDYGDGNTNSGSSPNTSHSYSADGVYAVILTVRDNTSAQCQNVISNQIEVYPKPTVSISASKSCVTRSFNLTGNVQSGSPQIALWKWDVNNTIGSIEATGQNASHIYNTVGTKTVALIAISTDNCSDTVKKLVYANPLPNALFNVDDLEGCSGDFCVTFKDSSTLPPPGKIISWSWNFGQGTPTVITNTNTPQKYCYTTTTSSQVTNYDIRLVVRTDSTCVDTTISNSLITVYPKPEASFTYTPTDANVIESLVYFTNTSQDYSTWLWYFGDYASSLDSTNKNPTHVYESEYAQPYPVFLMVKNQYGCTDTTNKLVEVGPGYAFYIPNAFTPNEDGINDVFSPKAIGVANYEMWIFDRWDNMIFYTNDINKGWDGIVKNKDNVAVQDAYIYKIKLKDILGKKHEYLGHVTVVK